MNKEQRSIRIVAGWGTKIKTRGGKSAGSESRALPIMRRASRTEPLCTSPQHQPFAHCLKRVASGFNFHCQNHRPSPPPLATDATTYLRLHRVQRRPRQIQSELRDGARAPEVSFPRALGPSPPFAANPPQLLLSAPLTIVQRRTPATSADRGRELTRKGRRVRAKSAPRLMADPKKVNEGNV